MLELSCLKNLHLQIDDCICPYALHGVQFQITLKISGIEPWNWQTVAKTSLESEERMAQLQSGV